MRTLQSDTLCFTLFCFLIIFSCLTSAASTERFYYGNDKLQPLIEEDLSSGQRCHIVSLGYGMSVKDCVDHTSYVLADHLSSVHAVINDKKEVENTCEYGPYGENRSAGDNEWCKYTGTYQWDSTVRLYKTPGRVYDPSGKKFLSQDPNRQYSSPYTYTANNPIGMYDQSGSMGTDPPNLRALASRQIRESIRRNGFRANLDPDLEYNIGINPNRRPEVSSNYLESLRQVGQKLTPDHLPLPKRVLADIKVHADSELRLIEERDSLFRRNDVSKSMVPEMDLAINSIAELGGSSLILLLNPGSRVDLTYEDILRASPNLVDVYINSLRSTSEIRRRRGFPAFTDEQYHEWRIAAQTQPEFRWNEHRIMHLQFSQADEAMIESVRQDYLKSLKRVLFEEF